MRWRIAQTGWVGLVLGCLPGCFEVAPLPDGRACQLDSDCTAEMFCNADDECEHEPVHLEPDHLEPDHLEPDVIGPEPDFEPGPDFVPPEPDTPEPDAPEPDSPPPDLDCERNGQGCVTDDGSPGICALGACEPFACDEAADCPQPECATCAAGTCGVRANCAFVTLSCEGPPGTRLRVECGTTQAFQPCDTGNTISFGCMAGVRVNACCGVGERCGDVPIDATVDLSFAPSMGWDCLTNGARRAACDHEGLDPRSTTRAHCHVQVTDPLGK